MSTFFSGQKSPDNTNAFADAIATRVAQAIHGFTLRLPNTPPRCIAVPPDDLGQWLNDPRTLVVDIRPYAQYSSTRIAGALSLSVPPRELRPLFSLQHLSAMLPSHAARTRFSAWRSASRILVYDAHSIAISGTFIQDLLCKYRTKAPDASIALGWIHGGFDAVWAFRPDLIDAAPLTTEIETNDDDDDDPAHSMQHILPAHNFPRVTFAIASKTHPYALPEDPGSNGMAPVDALLHHRKQRAALLAKGLSASDLHVALRACHERICTSLLSILGSRDAKHSVLLLQGTRAQAFLDAVQDVLDRGSLPSAEHTSQARRLIIRLSQACDQLPSSLFITGVTDHDEHPTFWGGFGDIYRASFKGSKVALKRIRRFHAGADSPKTRLQFCREALVWQTLHHKYVLPLIGIDRETFPSSFCMVSPWMKHGTILKYLNEHGRADVDKMLLQIAQGLGYLHSMKVVHGDLRGTNILVSEDWNVCLADFGLTGIIDDAVSNTNGAHTSSNHAGSLRWFAPELIAPTTFGCERFVRTPASDVYAFACLYTGAPPFSDVSPDIAAMLKVVTGERPARPAPMSDNLWQLVTAAWAQNFLDRPGLEAIIDSMRMLL
ncbi:kinase-like domain-containing protein [Mycena capillaripes]|nr:kinase-like domain-containing protein [Mycena capillaripes]